MNQQVVYNPRLAVSLTPADNDLLLQLRAAMELKHGKRVSLADVVREALRTLAHKEKIAA